MARLRLIALDPEDLAVLAMHVQDAVAKMADVTYRPRERRFIALVNRFTWEKAAAETNKANERRRSALRIDRVLRAQVSGLDLQRPDTVLSILTVAFEPSPDPAAAPAGTVTLFLSGGGAIRLEVECLELVLEDLGPAWKAKAQPQHPADDASATTPSTIRPPERDGPPS